MYRLKAALWKGRSLLQHEVRANVGFGSFATNQYAALSGRMSASPPIATELMQQRARSRHRTPRSDRIPQKAHIQLPARNWSSNIEAVGHKSARANEIAEWIGGLAWTDR